MRSLRPALWGLATALGSLTMLLGMFSLSLVEGNMRVPAPNLSPTASPTALPLPSREVIPHTPSSHRAAHPSALSEPHTKPNLHAGQYHHPAIYSGHLFPTLRLAAVHG